MAKQKPPADNFDGIKLDNYVEPTGPQDLSVCWSCQKHFPVDRLVCLGGECVLPVCTHCWGLMPVADRLTAAKSLSVFGEENLNRISIRNLLDNLAKYVKEYAGDNGDDLSWLTGRRN